MSKLVDACGIPLADHRKWLPDRVADFPRPDKAGSKEELDAWRDRFAGTKCWWCGRLTFDWVRGELHHIARHDAPWAFFWCCSRCHRIEGDVAKSANLYRVLVLKHRYDREHTSWNHLAQGLRRFLPTEEGE